MARYWPRTTHWPPLSSASARRRLPTAGDTEKPNEVEKWYAFCAQMRDAAAAVNAGIRAQDQEATEAAMEELDKSCDDCHAIFHDE